MILFITIAGVLGFYWFAAVDQNRPHRWWYATVALIILVGSVITFVLHDNQHLGMTTTTKAHTVKLASMNDKINLLVYQPIGTQGDRVYIYQTPTNHHRQMTKADINVTTKLSSTNGTAKVIITKDQYTYKTGFDRFMFGIFGNHNNVKHTTYHFYVPNDWIVINARQAKQLKPVMLQHGAEIQAQVQGELMTQLTTNQPTSDQLANQTRSLATLAVKQYLK